MWWILLSVLVLAFLVWADRRTRGRGNKDSKGGEIGRLSITGLSLKQLYDSSSYNEWDKSGSVWSFTSKEGYFPIPNKTKKKKQ